MNRAINDIPIEENHDPLIDLASYPFVLSPAYFEQGLSDSPAILLRRAAADKLQDIQQTKLNGLTFKIWDGYRPRSVQKNLFDLTRDHLKLKNPDWDEDRLYRETSVFVAPADKPGSVPPHTTGGAVDLTLVDAGGAELDMGTGFDHFGPEASLDYDGLSEEVQQNRKFLRAAMESQDFTPYVHEWWHFDFGNQRWAARKNHDTAFYGDAAQAAAKAQQEKQHALA